MNLYNISSNPYNTGTLLSSGILVGDFGGGYRELMQCQSGLLPLADIMGTSFCTTGNNRAAATDHLSRNPQLLAWDLLRDF